jgi:hypothetical protein
MAAITITVPDAVVPRILVAFGHWGTDPATLGIWVNADAPAMQAAIKAWVKQQVLQYEANLAQTTKATTVNAEVW